MEPRGYLGGVLFGLLQLAVALPLALSAGCGQATTKTVSREQIVERAVERAKAARPEMGMIEASVHEVSTEMVTFKEAHTRLGGTPGPGAYPPGITDESPVWWVTVHGYFRYEGMPMPVPNGGHSRLIYEADRQHVVCYAQTGECFAVNVPGRLIGATPAPRIAPSTTPEGAG